MSNGVIQPSFAAGELSPKLYGRVDQALYRIGTRKMRNFFVHPGGCASNRPGTEFIGEIVDSGKRGRLIPFQFNGQVTYVLEFGDHLMRVIRDGGYVLSAPDAIYQIATPYGIGDLALLKYTQSADVMTFCHPAYQPQDLSRTGDAAWTFTPVAFAPQVARPSGLALSVPSTGSTTYRYKVTAVNADDTEESLSGLGVSVNISGLTRANPAVMTTAVAHNLSSGDEILITGVAGMTEINGHACLVNVTGSNTAELRQLDNSNLDSTGYSAYASGGTAILCFTRTTAAAALSTTTPITISWASQPGVAKFNVYREDSGTFGIIGSSAATSFKDTFIKADTSNTPPAGRDPFAGGNWPSTVAYHEQRKFFANSLKQPQTLWATQTGNFKNMNVSSPTKDDDAITRTLVASQVNAIKHMVSMNVLILLTSGAEWKCFAGSNSDAITPANCYTKPQSYNGASDLQPIAANNTILFVQEKGSVVRDISYEFASDSYTGTDRSVWADHLFHGHNIVEWGYAQEPFRIIWAVREDGVLLGFTYMKEQSVFGWHRHDTDGFFESVAVISEAGEDVAYFIVRRSVNGQNRRYVERLHSRQFDNVADAWFLDCALEYDGGPTDTVSGLGHLEGKTVGVLGDGNVFPPATVSGGTISLDNPASRIIIGLPFAAELETLDLDLGDPTVQGKRKKVSAVTVKLENSRGIKIGGVYDNGDYTRLTEVKERSTQMYGTPIGLLTGQERVILDPTWNSNGRILIRQDNPLPCTILAAIPEVDVGN
ncbi:MAG TPA: ubiquitin-activating E1 FCCH domain-containing protein [Dongiaceae bacterium]|nr:ubiquitin-activating E1 FCCH domain-containing protein [Dongiaceae bacterium]